MSHPLYLYLIRFGLSGVLLCRSLTLPHWHIPGTSHDTSSLTRSNKVWFLWPGTMSTLDTGLQTHPWHTPSHSLYNASYYYLVCLACYYIDPWYFLANTPGTPHVTPSLVSRLCELLLCRPLILPHLPIPGTPQVMPSLTLSNKIWFVWCTTMSTPDTPSLTPLAHSFNFMSTPDIPWLAHSWHTPYHALSNLI